MPGYDFRMIILLPSGAADWQPDGKRNQRGDFAMFLTHRIDVLAIFASFAFIGAILLGML